jgi:hypothetical protein
MKQHQNFKIFFSYAVDFIRLFTAESAFRISNLTYYRFATHLTACDGEKCKKLGLQLFLRRSGSNDPHINIGNA